MRPSGRADDALRSVSFETNVNIYAEGSCLVKFGNTHVLCTATLQNNVPAWLRNSGRGWVTAEYSMLPRATDTRINREAISGKQTGRTQEIQRLIGRSLRAVTNLEGFGERQIRVDCDTLQADGGTRTASITGGYVALYYAFQHMQKLGLIQEIPLKEEVAAVSCGIYKGNAILDLDYAEDAEAGTDANFVLSGAQNLIEVQATAEGAIFSRQELNAMLDLAEKGIAELRQLQRQALGLA